MWLFLLICLLLISYFLHQCYSWNMFRGFLLSFITHAMLRLYLKFGLLSEVKRWLAVGTTFIFQIFDGYLNWFALRAFLFIIKKNPNFEAYKIMISHFIRDDSLKFRLIDQILMCSGRDCFKLGPAGKVIVSFFLELYFLV